jgi:hypothetical protein
LTHAPRHHVHHNHREEEGHKAEALRRSGKWVGGLEIAAHEENAALELTRPWKQAHSYCWVEAGRRLYTRTLRTTSTYRLVKVVTQRGISA